MQIGPGGCPYVAVVYTRVYTILLCTTVTWGRDLPGDDVAALAPGFALILLANGGPSYGHRGRLNIGVGTLELQRFSAREEGVLFHRYRTALERGYSTYNPNSEVLGRSAPSVPILRGTAPVALLSHPRVFLQPQLMGGVF